MHNQNNHHSSNPGENVENDLNDTSENLQMEENSTQDEKEKLKAEVAEFKDKYLRLYSEFENFRRRTSKEKIDFFKTANEDMLTSLIPVLDDFERAHKALSESGDGKSLTEGINLIYHKLFKTLEGKGLKPMESAIGQVFNSELQEAITKSPAPSEELKGKIMDVVEKGYYLHDKVIRFAKVIIGA